VLDTGGAVVGVVVRLADGAVAALVPPQPDRASADAATAVHDARHGIVEA
jgi:hypothetical protein